MPAIPSAGSITPVARDGTIRPGAVGQKREAQTVAEGTTAASRKQRTHQRPGRPRQVFVRLSEEEYAAIAAAAARENISPTSYVGVAALAAARGTEPPGAPLREALSELMQARTAAVRVGVSMNKIAAKLLAGAEVSDAEVRAAAAATRRAVARVERAADHVHRRIA